MRPSQAEVRRLWNIYGTPTSDKTPATKAPPRAALPIASYPIPFTVPRSQKDRQMLHYFCVQGSRGIAGFLSSDFWSRTILQKMDRNPVVRHALVSLSSVNLDSVTADAPWNGMASPETFAQSVDLKWEVKELIPANVLQEKDFLMQQYDRWLKKFDNYGPRAEHDEQAMAEYILRGTGEGNASATVAKNPRRNLSSETAIVAPLFLLAMRCSDESVCSRAAELLATARRREELYDAQTMARTIGQLQDLRVKRQVKVEGYDVEYATNMALDYWIPY
ncbi:hypothetical protein DL767_005116 [Monosporascus sp. MG133]|nr:hypothetical protein DL767_005116 [Monosporascus sp. MG133]